MKISSNVFLTILTSVVLISCGTTKEVVKEKPVQLKEETLIVSHCGGEEFFTTKEYFRANSIGESSDHTISKKKALANVKAELAGAVNSTVKAVTDNYIKSSEMNNIEQAEERFEELSRVVVEQKLVGISTICEKTTRTAEGRYKTYIAIELSAMDIVTKLSETLSKDDILKVDYDYEKFKKTFEEELSKLR